ncbi:MAG TPA: hypothetical protein VLG11_02010 [Candidatus Saccharimonadales bacterium]|nr:hypothetical protein [Candidatus Saccharimonadales bacterium]
MIDELNTALGDYRKKWQALIKTRQNKQFFEGLKPTAIGWKTTDRAEYDRLCAELHDLAGHIVETWMNGRWTAKFHLRDSKLTGFGSDIEIIKIMQRRPGSTDAVGLDHVDFYSEEVADAEQILQDEPDLKWTNETNDIIAGYGWISLWFNGTEAKLKSDTVLDIIRAELQEVSDKIKSKD